MNIRQRIKIDRICKEILFDKGKSKKVVMAEFRNRKSNEQLPKDNIPKA